MLQRSLVQLLLHYQSALRPTTMCSAHRHVPTHAGAARPQPMRAINRRVFRLCPENWRRISPQHQQRKSHPNLSKLTSSFIPSELSKSPFIAITHYLHISLYLFFFFRAGSHFMQWITFWPLCGCDKLRFAYEKFDIWSISRTPGSVSRTSCVNSEPARWVHGYVSPSVTSQPVKPVKPDALSPTGMRSYLHLDPKVTWAPDTADMMPF